MGRRILEGVRVLDITQIVAGPVCTRMLADLGADVVKIDQPSNDASVRRRSAGPAGQNVGKRSIVIDLKCQEGREIAASLVAAADVLVENYRPGALERLGLGSAATAAINPRLIYASISGFGNDTSFASRGAYGATAHAEAGWLWVQQQAQGGTEPFAPGVTVADIATGMNACTAILAALYDRERTGAGQIINVTLMDSQLAFLAEAAAGTLAGEPFQPFRHGLQRTNDGYLAVNAGTPRNWRRLAEAIGTDEAISREGKAIERAVSEWAEGRSTRDAATALAEADAPYGVVRTMQEALDHPYFAERRMIDEVPDPLEGPVRVIGSPLRFSAAESGPVAGAPLAGEHTVQVLGELGLDKARINELLVRGAVQTAGGAAE